MTAYRKPVTNSTDSCIMCIVLKNTEKENIVKLTLEQVNTPDTEVIIRGDVNGREVRAIIEKLNTVRTKPDRIELYSDDEQYYISPDEIIYFTASDDTVEAHTAENIYKCKLRLYELREMLSLSGFAQINKGTIVNVNYVRSIQAEFSGNYIATLKTIPEKLVISRRYFKEFKDTI